MAFVSGCRKQVGGYDYPGFDPQPTLNAILREGQPVWAHISLAQSLGSIHPAACTNAEVLLYVDGQFAERLRHEGDGIYTGETTAEALHEYAYKVAIPGFDTLFARTEMPEKSLVTKVEIMENATVDEEGDPCLSILVTFGNNPDKQQYFNVSIDAFFRMEYENGYFVSGGTITSSNNTDDPVLLNEGSGQLLFSNEIIADTSYTMKVNTAFSSFGGNGSPSACVRSGWMVVRMHGLSESAYHYMKSQNAFEEPDAYTNLFLGIITPLNLYGNVENGRGVFAAINPMICDTVFLTPKNDTL